MGQLLSGTRIVSTGSYVPSHTVYNEDLRQFPTAVIPLIEQKTGIRARRHAAADQCTSDLAFEAARNCLARARVEAASIDAIVLATSSPDRLQPATATRVQHLLGATKAFAFDINSVCSGAVFAISIADSLIRSGSANKVLVVAAEIYSRYLNPADFSTYPYFGDGAGAVLLEATQQPTEILGTTLHTDGSGCEVIQVPAGGTMQTVSDPTSPQRYFTMKGKEVYQFAISRGPEGLGEVLQRAGVSAGDVDWLVSHQANRNVILEIAKRAGISESKCFMNLDRFGNTAAASVLIALDELRDSGKLTDNHLVVLLAFGGGLSWGAALIRWKGGE